jgi:hypothetical protein
VGLVHRDHLPQGGNAIRQDVVAQQRRERLAPDQVLGGQDGMAKPSGSPGARNRSEPVRDRRTTPADPRALPLQHLELTERSK